MIRAVTFDVWNTLLADISYVEPRTRYLAKILSEAEVKVDMEKIVEAYHLSHNYSHIKSKMENYRYVSIEERVNYILEKLGVHIPRRLKMDVIEKFKVTAVSNPPSLTEDAETVIKSLSHKYALGIICDTGMTPGAVLREILRRKGILKYFKVTVFSDETGYNKPHRVMFEKAVKGLNVAPKEALHVGDLLETDVKGAKAMGMISVWLNRGERREIKDESIRPDYEIHRLRNLLNILEELEG